MESTSSGQFKRARMLSSGTQVPSCLVDGCTSDLSKCRDYHRRHKVCELHSKTPKVLIKGQERRFCQQCSGFHSLVEFDEGKRSCRKRLDGHNRRRRKPQSHHSPSVNSARLLSTQQGTRYLQFGSSQIFPATSSSSAWAGVNIKPENDPIIYNTQSSLEFGGTKNLFPGSISQNYTRVKQFPFLQDPCSTIHGDSIYQPNLDANSAIGSSGSSQALFSGGVIGSNRALSLLSSPPAETREIASIHVVQQSDLNPPPPPAQPLMPCLNYDGIGMEIEAEGSVLVNDCSSNANIHGHESHDMFQDWS